MSISGLDKRRSRSYYVRWIGVFFLMLFMGCGALYYATQKVDYVWRWFRVPQYFVYLDQVDIRAEIEGEVDVVKEQGDHFVVTVKDYDDTTESYEVPKEDGEVRVYEGDLISPGDTLGYYEEWKIGLLLEGLWITLKVSFLAIIVGIVLGLGAGLARISENPALKWTSITYIEIIRGSPLLVQIFIWYFVFGTLINNLLTMNGLPTVPPLWYGVISLAVFTGAYVAEIIRAGIQSIHRGQTEAARSLGLSHAQCMIHVVLPQAFRRIIPPLAGQFISLIKDSSLLGIIAIRELTKATREVVTTSLQPFELWFLCAVLYLVLTFTLSMLLQHMERRFIKVK